MLTSLSCCHGNGLAVNQALVINRWFKTHRELFVRSQVRDA
jgi:hypothetical protein